MINLGTLKTEFAAFLVNQDIASRIPEWIHWVLADIFSEYDYWWNEKSATFTTVSGTAQYFLNHRISMKQVTSMFDETNNREITEKPLEWIYQRDPTPTETGSPNHWAFVDQAEVQNVTASAGTVSIASSSTADLNIPVIVRGKVNGVEVYESINSNGTTSVAGTLSFDSGSTTDLSIESVALGQAMQGVLTVTGAGSVTLATIPPGYLRVQCPRIRLDLVPGGAYTIRYFYKQKAVRPVSNYDIIDIPDEAFTALRYGLEEIGHINNGDPDFAKVAAEKYRDAKWRLFKWSTRGLNENEIKDYCPNPPFGARLPETISGSVTV